MDLFFDSIEGLYLEKIFLEVLEEEGGILDREILRQNHHGSKKIILQVVLWREQDNLVEAPQFRV
jgi:hypothetical protein